MKWINHEQKGIRKMTDREWVILMRQARELNLNKRDIRTFLQKDDPKQM